MKYLQLVADTIVQKVRDYPKGFLVLAGVLIAVAWFA
jgi:hypothetical protein